MASLPQEDNHALSPFFQFCQIFFPLLFIEWICTSIGFSLHASGVLALQQDRKSPMIADTSPLDHIGPKSLPTNRTNDLKLHTDQHDDKLGSFFSTLSWTDRQILALHFAERLSAWEIHVVMSMSMSDVLCRIQRLRKIARDSIQASRRSSAQRLSLK